MECFVLLIMLVVCVIIFMCLFMNVLERLSDFVVSVCDLSVIGLRFVFFMVRKEIVFFVFFGMSDCKVLGFNCVLILLILLV